MCVCGTLQPQNDFYHASNFGLAGWVVEKTKEGEEYYVNHAEKCTSWTIPVAPPESSLPERTTLPQREGSRLSLLLVFVIYIFVKSVSFRKAN